MTVNIIQPSAEFMKSLYGVKKRTWIVSGLVFIQDRSGYTARFKWSSSKTGIYAPWEIGPYPRIEDAETMVLLALMPNA